MKLVKMRELAKSLGIPRKTFQRWIHQDPTLAVYRQGGRGGGSWWIRVDKLAERTSMPLVDVYQIESMRWVRAVDLARMTGISRRTMAHWCKTRPRFGVRFGRIWYVDPEQLGLSEEQAKDLIWRLEEGSGGNKSTEVPVDGRVSPTGADQRCDADSGVEASPATHSRGAREEPGARGGTPEDR